MKHFRVAGCFLALLVLCGFYLWQAVLTSRHQQNDAEYKSWLASTAANLIAPAGVDHPDDSLKIYAVGVAHTPPFKKRFIGYGIYLGNGTVITAAHVVGHWPSLTNLRVIIAGEDLPAKVVKEGSVDDTDLALLSVDQDHLPVALKLRRNRICKQPLQVGMSVIIDYPERTVRSAIISPLRIPPQFRIKFGTLINEAQGSGAGVFGGDRKCLIGIISRKIKQYPYRNEDGHIVPEADEFAGYFVPVFDFIPPEFRF